MSNYHIRMNHLETSRDKAANLLMGIQNEQVGQQSFIGPIAVAMKIQLSNVIEKLNEKIDGLNDEYNQEKERDYVQLAFDYLKELSIPEDEIPF